MVAQVFTVPFCSLSASANLEHLLCTFALGVDLAPVPAKVLDSGRQKDSRLATRESPTVREFGN
jgi:hypothetical protein